MKTTKQLRQSDSNLNNGEVQNPDQPRFTRNHRIRYEQSVPHQFTNNLVPLNAYEQKDRFLRRNLTPEFHLSIPTSEVEISLLSGHRSFNEGLQPWYGKREIYGLGPTNTNEAVQIEEGLACLHTILRAEHKYLGLPALLYYGSCMAEYLPFKDLFEHLGKYVVDEEQRWKHCMRIKRCLPSQDRCGGYGKDQRYFEGAVTILREQANIDFSLLMAGKLTLTELHRARRSVIMAPIRLPTFMLNKEKYLSTLRQIARMNSIPISKHVIGKNRPRSLTLQTDSRNGTSGAFVAKRCSSTNFPQQSPTSSTPIFEIEEIRKKHSKNSKQIGRVYLPKIENVHSDQLVEKATNQESKNTLSKKETISVDKESFASISTRGSVSLSHDSNPMESARQAVRNRISRALNDLELPKKGISNAFGDDNINKLEEHGGNRFKPDNKPDSWNMPQKGSSEDNEGCKSQISSLPTGVCGCRLFTHGSLRVPTVEDGDKRKREAKNMDTQVPIILELDLRHPVMGIASRL